MRRIVATLTLGMVVLAGTAVGVSSEWARAGTSQVGGEVPATLPNGGVPYWVVEREEKEGEKGVLLFLPGVSGYRGLEAGFVKGAAESFVGVKGGRVVVYDWTAYDPGFGALLGYPRNVREARVVARKVEDWVKQGREVTIVAHSGGCGVAAWALEQLPEGVKVKNVVMMASALSPGYDLRKAISRVEGSIWAMSSDADPVLGTATKLAGTIDRVRSDSAGLRGFVRPEGVKEEEYRKLRPLAYRADWEKYGHLGDHIGYLEAAFAKSVVMPLVVGEEGKPADKQPSAIKR